MTMPSWSSWYSGRDAIATFLSSWPLSLRKRWQILPTGANGQLAVAGYCWDQQMSAVKAETIIVLTFQAARIEEITAFRSPEPFRRFGCSANHGSTTGAPGAGRGCPPQGPEVVVDNPTFLRGRPRMQPQLLLAASISTPQPSCH
jgi:hypothetical protein